MKISKNAIKQIMLFIVLLSMVLFAYDKYNIKIFLCLIYIILNLQVVLKSIRNINKFGMLIMMTTIYPISMMLISTITSGGDYSAAIHAVYIHLFLLIVFILLDCGYDVYKLFFIALSIEVILILLIACMDFVHIVDLYKNPITLLVLQLHEGQISKSHNAIFYYVIFFNSSPLLIYHFVYALISKKYVWSILSFAAILFTGTRANIYIALMVIPIYAFFLSKGVMRKFIICLAMTIIVIIMFDDFYDRVKLINSAKLGGDLIRSNTVFSIINALNKNPLNWIWGMGHGSSYYSYGRNAMVSTSELSYLELIRTVGILGSIPFLFFLLRPIIGIWKGRYKWILIPYGALLITSFIDPFLYTSTSFCIYIMVYYTFYIKYGYYAKGE